MAQKTTIELIDDLDGKKADQTVTFSLDGVTYEIDLSDKNAEALRKAFGTYVDAGRKVAGSRSGSRRSPGGSSTKRDPSQTAAIKEWAKKNGYQIAERGRIKQEVLDAYEKAN